MPLAIEARLTTLLDLQSPIDDALRREDLLALLHEHLLPLMEASAAASTVWNRYALWDNPSVFTDEAVRRRSP